MNRKIGIISVIMIAVLSLTTLATVFNVALMTPVFAEEREKVEAVFWPDPDNWYMDVKGVLSNDSYLLFPHNHTSLNIGFSKFAEFIDARKDHKKGLEFGAVDPFAPPGGSGLSEEIPESWWLNGWLINITYQLKISPVAGAVRRNVWAMAQYSTTYGVRGPWLRVDFPNGDCAGTAADGDRPGIKQYCEDPMDLGHVIEDEYYKWADYPYDELYSGGRVTNGTAVTEPIRVLYDDGRRFVALLNTTIYDHPEPGPSTEADIPLVSIIFTIDFYKDKHQVIVLKDIKSKVPVKQLVGKINVQFSERGEWDLGDDIHGYKSYVHFYTYGTCGVEDQESIAADTVYNEDYHTMMAHPSGVLGDGQFPEKTCFFRYAIRDYSNSPTGWNTFDLFQAINRDAEVVGYAAYWPPLSDWTVYGWDLSGVQSGLVFRSMDAGDPHFINIPGTTYGGPGEPEIPYVIAEWDFDLGPVGAEDRAFRAVGVYGVTKRVSADDEQLGGKNILEDEVINYTLREVFNPWDLSDASSKEMFRWAYRTTVPSDGQVVIDLTKLIPEADWRCVNLVEDWAWNDYSVFAERIIDETTGKLLVRGEDYTIATDTTTCPHNSLKIGITNPEVIDHQIKVLFSTNVTVSGYGRYEWIVVGRDSKPIDSAGAAMVAAALKDKMCISDAESGWICSPIEVGLSGFDMRDPIRPTAAWLLHRFGTADDRASYVGRYGPALIDDWVNDITWPVSTSNIIAVGGPGANLVADYFNTFSQAIFRSKTGKHWKVGGKPYDWLIPSDWGANRMHPYPDRSKGEGLAIITTYKDLNGTVGFVIYGATGEDTWWATYWLYDIHGPDRCFTYRKTSTGEFVTSICADNGLRLLQEMNPGVTTIVLKITYPTEGNTPTFEIIKLLGTISTKTPTDP